MRILTAAVATLAIVSANLSAQDVSIPALARKQNHTARRASSTNPAGANQDNIKIAPGEEVTLARLTGPGIIRHCWFTMRSANPTYLSDLVLNITWDEQDSPAVNTPIGPFFGLGHDECDDVVSHPIAVMAANRDYAKFPPGRAAFNCYFPMPFRKAATLTANNLNKQHEVVFFFHIDWQEVDALPEDACYFHAHYRSERTSPEQLPDGQNPAGKNNYVILDTTGSGHYVGCTLHVEAHHKDPGKWYEGDDMIVVDDEPIPSAILGTGSEDYFNMAWGVRRPFQAPYFGTSYHRWNPDEPTLAHWGRFSLYRWHWLDPIPFRKSIRVTIEHGHNNDAGNSYASVAYWYAAAPSP
jgi:hypothetical protein